MSAGWEVEGFIERLMRRDDSNSERLVLEAISHLRAFSRDCDALRETNARLRHEKVELVEALRIALPWMPAMRAREDIEIVETALRSAKTEENPRGKVVRKEILATDVANPEWVRLYMPGFIDPIIGRSGTLFEETEEILQSRAEKRSIIRVVDGKDSVVWQACYAVHHSPTETKDGQS